MCLGSWAMNRIRSSRSSKAYCALQGPHSESLQTAQLAKTIVAHCIFKARLDETPPDPVERVPAHGRQMEQDDL